MSKPVTLSLLAGLILAAATNASAWWGSNWGWNPYDPWDPRYWMEEFFGGGYYGGGPWGYGGGPWGYGGGPWGYGGGPWGYGGVPWGGYGPYYGGYGYGYPLYGNYAYAQYPTTLAQADSTKSGSKGK